LVVREFLVEDSNKGIRIIQYEFLYFFWSVPELVYNCLNNFPVDFSDLIERLGLRLLHNNHMRLQLLVLWPLVLLRVVVDDIEIVVDHVGSSLKHLVGVILLPTDLLLSVSIIFVILGLVNIVFLMVGFASEVATESRGMSGLRIAFFWSVLLLLRHGQKVGLDRGNFTERACTITYFYVLL
jgi:hypothetical protein